MGFNVEIVAIFSIIVGAACAPPRLERGLNCPFKFPNYLLDSMLLKLNTANFNKFPLRLTSASISTRQPRLPKCATETAGMPINATSSCPWYYHTTDLGDDSYYPRYILDATCMCSTCIHANAYSCKKIRTNIAVFKKVSCQNGVAVFTAIMRRTSIGCFCASSNVVVDHPSGIPTE